MHGIELGRRYALDARPPGGSWLVGRGPDCDVRLPFDATVSLRHAEVRADGRPGHFLLVDERSRNGSFVNWRPLMPATPAPVGHGDVLGFGRTLLVLRCGPH